MDADGADPGPPPDPAADPASWPGVDQFQRAALDAIGAARVMLEAAEHLVRDPAAIEAVVRTVAAVARSATETVSGFAAEARARTPGAPPTASTDAPDAPDDDDRGYQRISLS